MKVLIMHKVKGTTGHSNKSSSLFKDFGQTLKDLERTTSRETVTSCLQLLESYWLQVVLIIHCMDMMVQLTPNTLNRVE